MKIRRVVRPFRPDDRWSRPRRVVWFIAVGVDGNVADGPTAAAAALALRRQYADPEERREWRDVLDDEERAAITAYALR